MLDSGRSEIQTSADIVAEEFGALGTYEPAAGGSVELPVVMTYASEFMVDEFASEQRDTAHVRMADVPTPAQGDTLTVDGESWTVDSYIRSGAMWALTLLGQ